MGLRCAEAGLAGENPDAKRSGKHSVRGGGCLGESNPGSPPARCSRLASAFRREHRYIYDSAPRLVRAKDCRGRILSKLDAHIRLGPKQGTSSSDESGAPGGRRGRIVFVPGCTRFCGTQQWCSTGSGGKGHLFQSNLLTGGNTETRGAPDVVSETIRDARCGPPAIEETLSSPRIPWLKGGQYGSDAFPTDIGKEAASLPIRGRRETRCWLSNTCP